MCLLWHINKSYWELFWKWGSFTLNRLWKTKRTFAPSFTLYGTRKDWPRLGPEALVLTQVSPRSTPLTSLNPSRPSFLWSSGTKGLWGPAVCPEKTCAVSEGNSLKVGPAGTCLPDRYQTSDIKTDTNWWLSAEKEILRCFTQSGNRHFFSQSVSRRFCCLFFLKKKKQLDCLHFSQSHK